MQRCPWAPENKPIYLEYHDQEWGVPQRDPRMLFEMLCLEGAQAGLSWYTILQRRHAYRELFHHFNVHAVAAMPDHELEALRNNERIIRNRLKIYGFRKNAQAWLAMQNAGICPAEHLWNFVQNHPIQNQFHNFSQVPAITPLAIEISRDLKKRGFTFVGPTIIYAFLQAVGIVNDHLTSCHCYQKCQKLA